MTTRCTFLARLCCLTAVCAWSAAAEPIADALSPAEYRAAQAKRLDASELDPTMLDQYLTALRGYVAKRPFGSADYGALAKTGAEAMRHGADEKSINPAVWQFKADVAAILLTRQEGWETLDTATAQANRMDLLTAVRPLLVGLAAAKAEITAERPGPVNVVVLGTDPESQAQAERAQAEARMNNDAIRRRRMVANIGDEVAQTLRRYLVKELGVAADDEAGIIQILRHAGCSPKQARDVRTALIVEE